jgi:site-specific DNA-methyltransferase (adenine-specific)
VKFLNPCTKPGIFLRESTRMLVEGIKEEIPDLQERVNHILTRQVFGIGITVVDQDGTARDRLPCSENRGPC